MKRLPFALCLLAALLLPAFLLVYRPVGETAVPSAVITVSSPAPPSDNLATAAEARAETIDRFLQIVNAWETASGSEGDRLEEQLRNLITDENAADLLRAAPPRFQGTYVGNLLLARWAARDRAGALRWLASKESPSLFEVNAVTKDWILQDRRGVERYIAGLPASAWRSRILESVGRDALAHEDPELAFSFLQGMAHSPARTPLLANAVQQWAQWDPVSAVERINKLPDPAARERLILAVASGYARAAPDAAADWLRRSFPDGPTLDRGLAGVMQAWASAGNPASGADWIACLPAGPTRDHAFRALIAAWSEESAETLQVWLSGLPEGSVRTQADAALGSLAAMP